MTSAGRPTLVLVTGPGGAGKTTLAHGLAREIGCPVISRDEIKEGMVAATPDFVPGPSDPLTMRTFGLFFAVIKLLLDHRVTLVAEAAFQHDNWIRGLEPLQPLAGHADLRVLRCRTPTDVRRDRARRRAGEVASRAAHDDTGYFAGPDVFDAIHLDAPTLDVDTVDSYVPDLDAILAFVRAG